MDITTPTPIEQAQELLVDINTVAVAVVTSADGATCRGCGKPVAMPRQQGDALLNMVPVQVAAQLKAGKGVDVRCGCGARLTLVRRRMLLPDRGPDKRHALRLK